jgi:anti-anti-sigma factor
MQKEGSVMQNNDIVPGFDDEKDESLRIELERAKDCLVLFLNGYIDTYNSVFFQKRINAAIESGFVRLIFDCSGLNYVSSTGIGSFITFLKSVKPDGDVVLFGIQPKVLEVFQLLGFSQFFNVRKDAKDAADFFKGGDEGRGFAAFPQVFSCPQCSRKLKALKSGRFRCSECRTILSVGASGAISLG